MTVWRRSCRRCCARIHSPTRCLCSGQEHLIAELNHALHGKRSEKRTEDERQLAFENLSIALAEVEVQKEHLAAKAGDKTATRPAPRVSAAPS